MYFQTDLSTCCRRWYFLAFCSLLILLSLVSSIGSLCNETREDYMLNSSILDWVPGHYGKMKSLLCWVLHKKTLHVLHWNEESSLSFIVLTNQWFYWYDSYGKVPWVLDGIVSYILRLIGTGGKHAHYCGCRSWDVHLSPITVLKISELSSGWTFLLIPDSSQLLFDEICDWHKQFQPVQIWHHLTIQVEQNKYWGWEHQVGLVTRAFGHATSFPSQ